MESAGQLEAFEARVRALSAAAGGAWDGGRMVRWLFHGTSAAAAERIAAEPVVGFLCRAVDDELPRPPQLGGAESIAPRLGMGPHFDATAAAASVRAQEEGMVDWAWGGDAWPGSLHGEPGKRARSDWSDCGAPSPPRSAGGPAGPVLPTTLILAAVIVGRPAAAGRETRRGGGVEGAESVVDREEAPACLSSSAPFPPRALCFLVLPAATAAPFHSLVSPYLPCSPTSRALPRCATPSLPFLPLSPSSPRLLLLPALSATRVHGGWALCLGVGMGAHANHSACQWTR